MTEEEIKKYTQRMPASLHAEAKRLAASRKMSLNDFIIHLVENNLRFEKEVNPQIVPSMDLSVDLSTALDRFFEENCEPGKHMVLMIPSPGTVAKEK